MATETFRYIDYSDENKFSLTEEGRIELKEYSDDLLFYVSFNGTFNATYYEAEESPVITGTTTLENAGVFSQYGLFSGAEVKYDRTNFENLTEKGSIKFSLKPMFNNAVGYQEFNATSNSEFTPSLTTYSFRTEVEGTLSNDYSVDITDTDTMNDIQNNIWSELQGSNTTATLTSENKIRIQGVNNGQWVYIREPSAGNNLITLLGGTGDAYLPNGPTSDVNLVEFYNGVDNVNKITLTHTTESHLIFNMYDPSGTQKVNYDLGIWSNENITWYAFEINWNKTTAEFFIDGQLLDVFKTGLVRNNTTELYIRSGLTDFYGFDEFIAYNQPQHSEEYTVESLALTPYPADDPYIDIHFGSGYKENEVIDLNLNSSSNIYFNIKIANSWYYYNAGSWVSSDGSFSQTVGPSTMETKFPDLYFEEESNVVIRAFFHSDGATLAWLDEIQIVTETEEAQPAVLIGTVDLTNSVDLSTDYNVVISTSYETREVDLSSGAVDATAVILDEIKAAIDAANIEGLTPTSDDGNGHLVLVSSDKGKEAFIGISEGTVDNALDIVWGYEATDFGEQATGQYFDYSEIFRWIRSQLGAPTVPVELTDEQLQDSVSSSVYWYNYYRNAKENFIYVTLEGGPRDGWKIPEEVGGEDNIIEIIMKPRFPYTFFTGRDDFVGQAYMQWFFQQYQSGYRHWLGDYYITLSVEQDLNNIMGTTVQWHFYNGKIFIHPEPPQNMIIGIRFKSAVTMNEVNTNKFIKNYALGKAKTILGGIRATFGSSIPGGNEMIQLRGEGLIQEGKEEMESTLEKLRGLTEPLSFEWG